MKRKITIIILALFFINSNFSQTKNDSLKTYNNIKNWAVAQLTIAYIEDLKEWDSNIKIEKFKNKEEEQEWKTYKVLKSKYNKYSSNLDLKNFSDTLLSGWELTRDSIFTKYKSELVDDTMRINFNKISFLPRMSKTDKKLTLNNKRDEAINKIRNHYNKSLSELTNVNDIKKERNQNKSLEENNNKFKGYSMLIYLVLGLSLIFNFYLILKSKKRKRPTKIKNIESQHGNWNEDYIKTLKENGDLKREIDKYKKQIAELKKPTSSQLSKNSTEYKKDTFQEEVIQKSTQSVDIQNSTEDKKAVTINLDIKKSETKIIYLPAPFEDSRFATEDVSDTAKTSTLYQAEITKDINEGNLTIFKSADLSRALNSPNIYLETACNYENTYTSDVKNIEVVEKGIVVLEDNDWIVKKKLRIKFN